MENKLAILLFLLTSIVYGQTEIVKVNDHSFTFKTSVSAGDGDSLVKVELFRGKTKLLTHIIYQNSGDCNSEALELGGYETSDSSITFYSYWNRAGDAPASPYGARKQIYTVDSRGKMVLFGSEINIETAGFSPPYNNFEENELKKHIQEIEKNYYAKFVRGTTKDVLLNEVKTKLKTPIQKATKHWKKTYGDKFGGFKL